MFLEGEVVKKDDETVGKAADFINNLRQNLQVVLVDFDQAQAPGVVVVQQRGDMVEYG